MLQLEKCVVSSCTVECLLSYTLQVMMPWTMFTCCLLVHSFSHLCNYSVNRLFIYSFAYSLTRPFTRLFIRAFIHSLTHSLTHARTHSLTHSLTHSFVYPLTHAFVHSLTHSVCVFEQSQVQSRSCFGSRLTLTLYMQELDLELQQERQKAKEAEALNRKPQACSYCGELGHNRRGCPKLAKEQQQEEEKKRREQLGPLWGLAGVEEQRMPGGRPGVLVFPVPFQIEDAVDQVSVPTSFVMILTSSSSCS